jgi:hypothetical protein
LALKVALKDPASNVLWDGAIKPNTAKELIEALKARFGVGQYLESYEHLLTNNKRGKDETLMKYFG